MRKGLIIFWFGLALGFHAHSQPLSDQLFKAAGRLPEVKLEEAEDYFLELDSLVNALINSPYESASSHVLKINAILDEKSRQSTHHRIYVMALGFKGCFLVKLPGHAESGTALIDGAIRTSAGWLSDRLAAYWYYRLAQGYRHSAYHSKAMEYYQLCRKIYLNTKDSASWALVSSELAEIMYQSGHHKTASEILHSSLKIKQKRNISSVVSGYNTLGLIERKKQNIDSALFYFNVALFISKQYNLKRWHGLLNGNIGTCYQLQGKYDESIAMYRADIRLSSEAGEFESGLKAMLQIADIYVKTQQIKKLRVFFDSIILYAQNSPRDLLSENPQFYLARSNYHRSIGEPEKALLDIDLYISIKDSINFKNNQTHINQLEIAHRMADRENRITILEQKQQIENKAKTLRFIYRLIIIAIMLALLAFGVYMMIQNKNRKSKNLQLELQKAELAKQAEKLAELNAMKDKLFSIISHDLKTPFKTLTGLLSLFDAKALSNSEIEMLMNQVRHLSQGMYESLNNLLEWSKSQMQGFQQNKAPTNIHSIIESQIAFLRPQAQFKDILLKNETSDTSLMIWGDAEQISFMIRNLLANAIKFTHVGGEVRLSAVRQAGMVCISVEDNGIGMSEAQVESLLAKGGVKVSTKGTLKEKGTGFGLMFSKEFVEAHGGSIHVKSEEGKGSTFYVLLPEAKESAYQSMGEAPLEAR